MSHYGYVSEQLLNGDLFPPRRKRERRGRRTRRRERREELRLAADDGRAARLAPVGARGIELGGVRRVADLSG